MIQVPCETVPMRVAEIAELTGTTVRTVRYYHSLGLLPVPGERGGWRDYDLGHVARLSRIRWLVQAGVSLETIRRVLDEPEATGVERIDDAPAAGAAGARSAAGSVVEDLAEALAAGARAYLLKTVHGAEISDVVRAVASGRVLLDERTVTRRRADHDDPTADLTNAERKVLDLIGDGLSNREIGERLGVAEKTVKNHITSLLAKMGLQRRTQVAAWVAGQRASGWRNG